MIQQINVLPSQKCTHAQRNTHSSGSTCHIPLSPDNIAAVKVDASVIGRTNHGRRDEMVPSHRSGGRGELRQRTSCHSPAIKKNKIEVTGLVPLPSMHQCQFHSHTFPDASAELVFISWNMHQGLLQTTDDANLPSSFSSYLLWLPRYLLCFLGAESPLTSISHHGRLFGAAAPIQM